MNNPLQHVSEVPLSTLQQLAEICRVDMDWLLVHQRDDLLGDITTGTGSGVSSDRLRARISRMYELERDFEAVPELAALVADFLEELDTLRADAARQAEKVSASQPVGRQV